MSVNDDMSLLNEYTQWMAVQGVASRDLTPEAFIRDRLKEVALDRIEAAQNYIASVALTNPLMGVYVNVIGRILEGEFDGTDPEDISIAVKEPLPELPFPDPY